MSLLFAAIALACGLLSTTSSQNVGCVEPQSAANCTAWLDLSSQDNTTSNTTVNVCGLNVWTQLLNPSSICYSQCPSWQTLYLLINTSSPTAAISLNVGLNRACNGSVRMATPPPGSPNASLALVWTNTSVPGGCTTSPEQLLLNSVTFSMDLTVLYTSVDVCLAFFDPSSNASSSSSCVHLLPPPVISYTPEPVPAQFKNSIPVAVVKGGLSVFDFSNITYAVVSIDPSTYMPGDLLMLNSSIMANISLNFSGGNLTITGQSFPTVYTSLLTNVLFSSSVSYPASRLIVMTVCDATCCSQPVTISVELVYFTILFGEEMGQVLLGNSHGATLAALLASNPSTTGLNVTLEIRNSVLDSNERLYYGGGSSFSHTTTTTTSFIYIPNCVPMCTQALTSFTYYMYVDIADEPSYYTSTFQLVLRDIFVQLLNGSGSVITTVMLEVDLVPVNDHKPVLLLSLPCNSTTNVAPHLKKRQAMKQLPYGNTQTPSGRAGYSSDHMPKVISAILELRVMNSSLCLWSIVVAFSTNTSAPHMDGLGTILLLPAQLNDGMVGVAWEDKSTLVVKVTGCGLVNFTGVINLLFKPQGGDCTGHTPCTHGVCFANRTGCPVRGLYRVQLGTSPHATPSHITPGLMVLCLQSMTVGVVITLLLVMWHQLNKRRRSVGYKMAEDGGASLPKCPPPVVINITPPPKQLSRKSTSNCSQVPLRADPSGSIAPHSEDPTDSVVPCTLGHQGIGPPDVGPPSGEEGGGVELTSVQRWLPQLGGEEVCKGKEDAKHPREVEPCPQEVSQCPGAGSEGVEVYQEGLVATVGALQSKSDLRPSLPHTITSSHKGHSHTAAVL